MANLTGEYDAVVELSVGLLNAVLGAVHENEEPGWPPMPHSLNGWIDDAHQGETDSLSETERTGFQGRVEVQVSTPIVSLPVDGGVVHPTRTLARSATGRAEGGGAPAGAAWLGRDFGIRWPWRQPQVATRVRVRAWVRDARGPDLPEFIDGHLTVSTDVLRSDVAGVGTFLTMDRANGPSVGFEPAPGTQITDEQRQLVATIVRNVIRANLAPETFRVTVPPAVRHFDFTLQPQTPRPCVQLLLNFTDRALGPNARDSARPGILPAGADFAVGVGRDFLIEQFRSRLFQGLPSSYSYSKYGFGATIRPDWAGATFDLEPGRVVFRLSGDGDLHALLVDDHFTFSIRQAFTLIVVDGALDVIADGDVVVSLEDVAVGGNYLEGKARESIRAARDAALVTAAPDIRKALDLGGHLERILGSFHPRPAGVAITGVDIRPDGVVANGTVALAASGPIVVRQETHDGVRDAVDTWIPGGTIDRFTWEQRRAGPGSQPVRVEEHRFVTEDVGVSAFGHVCLTVEGNRVGRGGGLVPVSVRTCFAFGPVLGPVLDPVRDGGPGRPRPVFPIEGTLADGTRGTVGHYDPWGPGVAGGNGNLLLWFGAEGGEDPVALLREALKATKAKDAAVVAAGVVPAPGTSKGERESAGDVLLSEDPEGRWADAFGVSETPAAVLVGPGGDVVWRESGKKKVSAASVTRALDKHAARGGRVVRWPLRLPLRPGQRPPDVPLLLEGGRELTLRRLRGRPMVVTFWTSRSEPSLQQLDVLRDLGAVEGGERQLVIAVGDGETEDRAAEVAKERRLPFLVLPDPDRLVSRAFGVWCWPATVWIRPDMRIEAIDVGLTAGRS